MLTIFSRNLTSPQTSLKSTSGKLCILAVSHRNAIRWMRFQIVHLELPCCIVAVFKTAIATQTVVECVMWKSTATWTFSGFSVGLCINEEEGYLLPTWARKITCQRFDWMEYKILWESGVLIGLMSSNFLIWFNLCIVTSSWMAMEHYFTVVTATIVKDQSACVYICCQISRLICNLLC